MRGGGEIGKNFQLHNYGIHVCTCLFIPLSEVYHHSSNAFRVHGFKPVDTHRNKIFELVTLIGGKHNVETVSEDQIEREILREGLCEVSLELL